MEVSRAKEAVFEEENILVEVDAVNEFEPLVHGSADQRVAGAEEAGFQSEPEFVDAAVEDEAVVDLTAAEDGDALMPFGFEVREDFCGLGVGELELSGDGVVCVFSRAACHDEAQARRIHALSEVGLDYLIGIASEDGGGEVLHLGEEPILIGLGGESDPGFVVAGDASVEGHDSDGDGFHSANENSEVRSQEPE